MHFTRALLALPLLAAGATAQLVNIPTLNIGLGQNGALLTLDVIANLFNPGAGCGPGNAVGVTTTALLGLPLVKICACVNLANVGPILAIGTSQQSCNTCADPNATPGCGGGTCVCVCNTGFYSDRATGRCLPINSCTSPNVLTDNNDGTFTCTCVSPYQLNSNGVCTLGGSQRARSRSRRHERQAREFGNRAHGAGQQVYAPSASGETNMSCPEGETACPLASGGFECIDITNSLTACGGCPGPYGPGQDCLAIPGALNVQCAQSKCIVGSCFRGWRYDASGNGRCE
ncbi:hypothetical protein JCM10908_000193 [Rhodotorula pacifica]|uniref:uncharacterized protein n=1 Tax=Rhodotorula pacifica TaxID=1495444 RepID=UPI0031728981